MRPNDEWITHARALHDRLWVVSRLYEPIPPDAIFIAQDKRNWNNLVAFPNGLGVAYGHQEAERYMEDCHHIYHGWWAEKNPHLQPPDGHFAGLREKSYRDFA